METQRNELTYNLCQNLKKTQRYENTTYVSYKTQLMFISYSTIYVGKLLYTTCQRCPISSDKKLC